MSEDRTDCCNAYPTYMDDGSDGMALCCRVCCAEVPEVDEPVTLELPRDLADGSPYTAAELIAGLSRKLEGCTVRWACTGGPCFGIIVAADVRWTPRRYVLITEPDDHYSSAEIPAHPWFGADGAYAVGYYDEEADESHGCRPQIGWEQHDHASRLAADAARWLLDAELPRTAQKF